MPENTITAAPAAPASTLTLDNASQATSLDQLSAIAGGMEGQGAAAAGPAGAAPGALVAPVDLLASKNAEQIKQTTKALRDIFCRITTLKAPAAILTDEAVGVVANDWGKWTAKRGYDLSDLMGQHADTIPLMLSTGAIAWAVYEATKAEIAVRKPVTVKEAKADAPAPTPTPAPAVNTVSVFPGRGGA